MVQAQHKSFSSGTRKKLDKKRTPLRLKDNALEDCISKRGKKTYIDF